nr:salivary glue protein Sgs-3-like [Parasteatoda tepidariorum]
MLEYLNSKLIFGTVLCLAIGIFLLDSHVDASTIKSRGSSEERSEESNNIIEWTRDWDWNRDRGMDKQKNFKCPSLHGRFADIEDCSAYFECRDWNSMWKPCQRRKRFDRYRKVCLPFDIAVCDDGSDHKKTTNGVIGTTTPKDDSFTCPKFLGYFPHPSDCSKYYHCISFSPSLKTCPKNFLFDGVKGHCRSERYVNCGSRKRPTSETTVGTTPIPTTPEPTTTTCTPPTTPQPTTTPPTTTQPTTTPPTTTQPTTTPTTTTQPTTTPPTTTQPTTTPPTTTQPTTTPPTTSQPTTTPPTTPQPTTTPPTTTQPTTTPPTTPQPTTTPPTTPQPTTTPPTTSQPTTIPPTTPQPSTPTPKPTEPPETDCDEDDLECIIKETGDITVWFKCPEAIGAYRHPSSNRLFIFCKNWKPFVKKCGQMLVYSEQMRTCVNENLHKMKKKKIFILF